MVLVDGGIPAAPFGSRLLRQVARPGAFEFSTKDSATAADIDTIYFVRTMSRQDLNKNK